MTRSLLFLRFFLDLFFYLFTMEYDPLFWCNHRATSGSVEMALPFPCGFSQVQSISLLLMFCYVREREILTKELENG